jgi:hypothetical protein
MLSFLFQSAVGVCDLNISVDSTNVIYSFNMTEESEICINATNLTIGLSSRYYYLVLSSIPGNSRLIYYRQKVVDGDVEWDFEGLISNLSVVQSSIIRQSSFTIQATSSAIHEFWILGRVPCPDGLMALSGENRLLSFASHESEPYNLSPFIDKCVFLMNSVNTTVFMRINIALDQDYVYYYTDMPFPVPYTGEMNVTLVKSRREVQLLLRIQLSSDIIFRSIDFAFTVSGGSEQNRTIFLGPLSDDLPTPSPIPTPETLFVMKVSIGYIALLGATGLVFCVILVLSCYRYRWYECRKPGLRPEKLCVSPDPRLPSSYLARSVPD